MMKFLKKFYIYIVLIFLYAPVFVMAVYSFNESRTSKKWGGFSLKWYESLFHNEEILSALYYTLIVAAVACIVSTIVGTISAIGIYSMSGKVKSLMLNVNYLPVINPDIVTGISMMLLFGFCSIRQGFFTMLIAHITFCIPYVVLSVLPKLNQMDKHLVEAAMDLGATPAYTLRKIVIPEILPGILTGALMAFTLSIDDFVISFFSTGSGVSNLSIYVYSAAKRGISPEINALSTLMILTVSVLLAIVNFGSNKKSQEKGDR
ncbi:MAG: ABC transporter permease [Anaerofustis stercorihominis]|nr:ABC transporter permease [Anaerofustis stercorihominis]